MDVFWQTFAAIVGGGGAVTILGMLLKHSLDMRKLKYGQEQGNAQFVINEHEKLQEERKQDLIESKKETRATQAQLLKFQNAYIEVLAKEEQCQVRVNELNRKLEEQKDEIHKHRKELEDLKSKFNRLRSNDSRGEGDDANA